MKRFLAAMALTCTLSVSTLAGDITTSGLTSPPPPPTTETTGAASPGEFSSGDFAQQTLGDEVIENLLAILYGLVF